MPRRHPQQPERKNPLYPNAWDPPIVRERKKRAFLEIWEVIDSMEELNFTWKWKSRHLVFTCAHGKDYPMPCTIDDYNEDPGWHDAVLTLRRKHRQGCGKEN